MGALIRGSGDLDRAGHASLALLCSLTPLLFLSRQPLWETCEGWRERNFQIKTKTKRHYKIMHVLYANPITERIEITSPVVRAETREELEEFEKSCRQDKYKEDMGGRVFIKSYRKGTPLEMFNPPQENGINRYGAPEGFMEMPTIEEEIETLKKHIKEFEDNVPNISKFAGKLKPVVTVVDGEK